MTSIFSRRELLRRLAAYGVAAPLFDIKHPAGLNFTHLNSPTAKKYLIETMPGGVALLDYNKNGLLD